MQPALLLTSMTVALDAALSAVERLPLATAPKPPATGSAPVALGAARPLVLFDRNGPASPLVIAATC